MPLVHSSSKKALGENIRRLMHEIGKSPHVKSRQQAIAIAESTKRRAAGRAMGGAAPMMSQAMQPAMPGSMLQTGMMPGNTMMPGNIAKPPINGVVGQMPMTPTPMAPTGINAPMAAGQRLKRGGATKAEHKLLIDRKITTGPLVSTVPGRTDRHLTHVPSGAYVIPADIVSAHGEGNTLAGIAKLHKFFKMAEHSAPASKKMHNLHKLAQGLDKHVGKPVKVKLAGGEIVVPPENVHETMERIFHKKLTLDQAHSKMDSWVVHERKKLRNTLAKLPGPVKS